MTPDRYETLLTASSVLLLLAAILGGLGTFGRWYFDRKLTESRQQRTYRYFEGPYAFDPTAVDESSRPVLNELDAAKRRADDALVRAVAVIPPDRLRSVNDYVFKVFRHIRFLQETWFRANGRYFQGKPTMESPPSDGADGRVELQFGLTDQVDDWRDVGYVEEAAPVQLRCDVYDGPKGQGYVATARVLLNGRVWQNHMHIGPEERGDANYLWSPEPDRP